MDDRSPLAIIEGLLRMVADQTEELRLTAGRHGKYWRYLLKTGLIATETGGKNTGRLGLTASGKAFLALLNRIEALDPNCDVRLRRAETQGRRAVGADWRKLITRAYIFEQAEIIRLETQLAAVGHQEAEMELRRHKDRLETLKSLWSKLERLAGS